MIAIKTRETTIIVNSRTNVMECTRLLDSKIHLITMVCDGTVGDLGKKVETVSTLDNDIYVTLAAIEKEAKEDVQEP